MTIISLSSWKVQGSDKGFHRRLPPRKVLMNVVGILEGRSKADEVVVFSAHYDHLGAESWKGSLRGVEQGTVC